MIQFLEVCSLRKTVGGEGVVKRVPVHPHTVEKTSTQTNFIDSNEDITLSVEITDIMLLWRDIFIIF